MLALDSGAVALPDTGAVALCNPSAEVELPAIAPDRLTVVQGFFPDHAAWTRRGVPVVPNWDALDGPPAASIVCVPRARDAARDALARAAALGGPVIVDGLKTDGIDSLWKAVRAKADTSAAFSKAHGKTFQIAAGADLSDWRLPELTDAAQGWKTAPGIFSADGPDPGSVALAAALPPLAGRVADLGAGWGFLSASVLAASPQVDTLHLVEAEHAALQAARANVTDSRAQFHWDDATQWKPTDRGGLMDHIVMNPPFHTSRKADPGLGRAFLARAAALLAPRGSLWLVANRHLPYEEDLERLFAERQALPGPASYKLIRASRPRTQGRRRPA